MSARCQKNDQFGVGQMARIAAPSLGKCACLICLLPGWLGLRGWLPCHRGRMGRMSDPANHTPLLIGLAHARFGLGVAAFGLPAAWKWAFDGRGLSPRVGGTRLCIMKGMTREDAQELGVWKSPGVTEAVRKKDAFRRSVAGDAIGRF